jgi:hypothetical protein
LAHTATTTTPQEVLRHFQTTQEAFKKREDDLTKIKIEEDLKKNEMEDNLILF